MSRVLEIVTPLGGGEVFLQELDASEGLSRSPEYRLRVLARKGNIEPKDLLGKNVTFAVALQGAGEYRHFNGYVTSFRDLGQVPSTVFEKSGSPLAYLYELVVHTWLHFLARQSDCRIFQKKKVPDIVDEIVRKYPFAKLDRSKLTGSYREWDYCCQYRETDFNFVSRLLEQEGIYYSVEHENGAHKVVLYDNPSAHLSFPGHAQIKYDVAAGATVDEDHLSDWASRYEVTSGKVALKDFFFETPSTDLAALAAKPKSHDLAGFELYDYPGEYEKSADGKRYADVRLEEAQGTYEVYSGSGQARYVEPGRKLGLEGHGRAALNKDYLIVSANLIVIAGAPDAGGDDETRVQVAFQAIDSKAQYRPPRITPKPVVQGPQTAMVVGPAGEEIFTNKHGQVKVQFHWDRYSETNENSSCWVRVSQPWAGKQWGAIFLPRVGQEVIVAFLEGDPDHPIVTGRVYNAEATPIWSLPDHKTRSGFRTRTLDGGTSNFNELRFEDKKGKEEIYQHAERDHVLRTKHDRVEYVGNESHLIVEKDVFEKFKSEHHLAVTGDQNIRIDGSYSVKAGQEWHGKVGTNCALDAGMQIHLKGGMTVVIEAGTQLSLKVGGNFIDINPGGVFIKGTLVMINSGGAAGSGAGASPQPPKDPREADQSQGGDKLKPPRPQKPASYSPQAQALKLAHDTAVPFCEVCAKAAAAGGAAA